MKSYMERVLLKTTIPKQTADELQRLGSEKYVSVTEVLRRAVAIYAVIHELVKSGNKILVEKPDGTFAQLTFK